MIERIPTSLTCLAASGWSGPSTAQEHEDINAANNPLTPKITINLHDYYLPELEGLDDRYADQMAFKF